MAIDNGIGMYVCMYCMRDRETERKDDLMEKEREREA